MIQIIWIIGSELLSLQIIFRYSIWSNIWYLFKHCCTPFTKLQGCIFAPHHHNTLILGLKTVAEFIKNFCQENLPVNVHSLGQDSTCPLCHYRWICGGRGQSWHEIFCSFSVWRLIWKNICKRNISVNVEIQILDLLSTVRRCGCDCDIWLKISTWFWDWKDQYFSKVQDVPR